MRYEGSVYRPPSEAYSLIVQVTIGCSHNRCSFCAMYKDKKFRVRSLESIKQDLAVARRIYRRVNRVFLADGDALICKTEHLLQVLDNIRGLFPECRRVGIYAGPRSILIKTEPELCALKEKGLGIIYLGLETGSDQLLKAVKKGAAPDDMIEASRKVKAAGIPLSVTVISGLGGRERTREHALESAKVLNRMDPEYLGLLTLLIEPGTPLYEDYMNGEFQPLSPEEVIAETLLLVEHLELSGCVFRSNHISNYVPFKATLPHEKPELLKQIKTALDKQLYADKPESFRVL